MAETQLPDCGQCGAPAVPGRRFCSCGYPLRPRPEVIEADPAPVPERLLRRPGEEPGRRAEPIPDPRPVEPVDEVEPDAVPCPAGHSNPPQRVRCRVCGDLVRRPDPVPPPPLPPSPAREVPLWVVPSILLVLLAVLLAVWVF